MVKQFDVSIPAAAGKIHRRGRTGTSVPPLSIPAAAGKIHEGIMVSKEYSQCFQFPQLRVRYIAKITKAHCISAAQFVQLSVFASFIIEEV